MSNRTHPECREGEVWVGNTNSNKERPELYGLETYRLGEQAYDINGQKLVGRDAHIKPMIMSVSDAEKYNRIMEEECRKIRRGR